MKASNSNGLAAGDDALARTVVAVAVRDRSLAAALTARLAASPDFAVARCGDADASQLASSLCEIRADVLLLDEQWLQPLGGAATLARNGRQARRVLVVTERACVALAEQVVRYRLQGFLVATDAAELCTKAVRAVTRGETWLPRGLLVELLGLHVNAAVGALPDVAAGAHLTRRETEVVDYVRRGFANKQIAASLAICEDTVKKHLRNAFTKLGVHRRSQIMTGAERLVGG